MAQNGVHGLVGLAVGRFATDPGAFRFGLVLGNIAPDLDLIPLALLYLADKGLALSMHRTFTHSLVTAAVVGLAGLWIGRPRAEGGRGECVRWVIVGLAAGMAMHGLLDVFVWFSGVDLGWPLGLLGLPSYVDLWAGYPPTGRLTNYLGAGDYLAYGLYLGALVIHSNRCATDALFRPFVRRWAWIFGALFPLYLILATRLSPGTFQFVHYGPFALVWVPLVVWMTVRMRATIEAM